VQAKVSKIACPAGNAVSRGGNVSEPNITDILKAAEQGLIRQDEFRKNATKFGWELWDVGPQPSAKGA